MARRLTRARAAQLRTVARIQRRIELSLRAALAGIGHLITPEEWVAAAAMRIVPASFLQRFRTRLAALADELVRRLVAEALTEALFEQVTRGPLDRVADGLEGFSSGLGDGVRSLADTFRALTEQTTADELARRLIGVLIRELEAEGLAAVRLQLALIAEAGITPEAIAAIGQATGLTARQVAQVERARRTALLQGASEQTAARAAAGVRARLLDYRAKLIAHHETVTYTNDLIRERGLQAAAAGNVVTKQSVSARDEHVDGGNPFGICRVLDDGRRIPLQQPFVFQGQEYASPPYHIGCRDILEIWVEDP